MTIHPVDKHVGSKLKSRRVMLGMSQIQLGEKIGITFQQIQKYEKGLNRIGCSRLYEISEILRAPVEYFFSDFVADGGSTNLQFSEELSGYLSELDERKDKEVMTLVKHFSVITDTKVRKKILALVKSLGSLNSTT